MVNWSKVCGILSTRLPSLHVMVETVPVVFAKITTELIPDLEQSNYEDNLVLPLAGSGVASHCASGERDAEGWRSPANVWGRPWEGEETLSEHNIPQRQPLQYGHV